MIAQWWQEILNYIQQYMNHSPLLYIYPASLLFLCFRGKDIRRMVVYPALLLVMVILNPLCYGYIWTKLMNTVYWRMLWMIPVIPVILCALSEFAKLINKSWVAPVVTGIFLLGMMRYGNNIYRLPGVYVKGENAYKLPEISVQVGEKLLELEEEPVVVAPSSLYCYLRQYSGQIHLVYGRDADGYIYPDWANRSKVYELSWLLRVNGGDTAWLVTLARTWGADMIVLPDSHGFVGLEDLGFTKAAEVGDLWIYQWSGS